MSRLSRSVSVFVIFAIAGCTQSQTDGFGFVARQNTGFETQVAHYDVVALTDQTAHLDVLMQDVVRKSTRKGIAMGAAVGCGLTVLSASNAQNCVAGALVGGATGGIMGHAAGKRDVARRVELVSANALTKSIRKTNDQMETITIDLPRSLAAQDIELADLAREKAKGNISADAYDERLNQVRAERQKLVEALTMTAAQAKAATKNLEHATAQGQTGLDWHMSATNQLARDVASARSQITLF
ncbi:hypothetical protein [Ascidiaceihabitans sp.]|uniref:hypothetical protein n=1 Tax=Ascidiaceihabitans sp. TaxID=1872644 RepID=UPI003299F20F